MSTTTKVIHVLERFSGVPDTDVAVRSNTVQISLTGNSHFPNPPVDLAALKTATDTLMALIAQAADGSKKVIAEKNKQRAPVIDMLRMLGRYVEIQSQGDMSIFLTSGFQAVSTTRASAQPLSENIRKIAHGSNAGQIMIWARSIPGALTYQIRYAPSVNGATTANWTEQLIAQVRTPAVLTGLTPGTTYAFQARAALKGNTYTDWSDSVTFVCT
jgi:hypothetical protein